MQRNRLFALLLAALMLLPMIAATVAADADWAVFLDFDGVDEPMPEGNLLTNGSFEDEDCLMEWDPGTQKLTHVVKSNSSYLRMSEIPSPIMCFDYKQKATIGAGTYKFTGYFRMSYENEVTELRLEIHDRNHNFDSSHAALAYVYPTHDEWLKVEFYVTLDSDFTGIGVLGGPHPEFIQSYCIDNFSLVKVDSIPEGYTMPSGFGEKVTYQEATASNNGSVATLLPFDPEAEKQYDIQGIVYNRDIDFIGTCNATTSRKDLENYVYGFRDTHITDFMINIFCQIATYPSDVASDFMDKYHYYVDQGLDVPDSRATIAHKLFEEKGLDYIKIFCEKFPEIGINPWLSFRMNDAHSVDSPNTKVAWDFFTENPQYRRVLHGSTTNTYYNNLFNYSHEGVRDYMLAVINEALGRYDPYGIELDFQRDIYIWHHGGEYPGLDILNDFMRDINELVAVYEEKYNHEIKVAVRCSSDIQTNYDLGYDLITWAAEGLMDLVNPTSRWATTDFNIPVKSWVSIMHPYGVEVAPGIEALVQTTVSGTRGSHDLDTMSAAAASWFSQGADKVYLYNHFVGLPGIQDDDRVVGGTGHFAMLTTIGCYEKVVNHDRLMMITYNDIAPTWKGVTTELPLRVPVNSKSSIRIPLGDVPEGAKVTLRMSASSQAVKNPPTVRVNGADAELIGDVYEPNTYTKDRFLLYDVPVSAQDDMFLVVEVTTEKYYTANYIDVVIEPAK